MPKLNRVRIVNFSYNNNNRHIIDECFDFYGGENALLCLANGGGKSVLVQAMLQPVLPKERLLKRRFADFFTGKKNPTYIMLEWKLDDHAGYLLSGIAITQRASAAAHEEEEHGDIRYFTFLSAYDRGNQYDIVNIPVADRIENSVRIASYNEFKKLLLKESGKGRSDLFVYDSARDEQSQYERKLSSYGISKEEWKELIVRINEAEHGVSEVFSECRTSRKVMEQWVIKYIEKVLDKSSGSNTTDHNKLETMMSQVARDLADNEGYIREYRTIEGFCSGLDELLKDTREVLTGLDHEDNLKKEIAGGYLALKAEEQKLNQLLLNTEDRLIELNDTLDRINLEERSLDIYKYTEDAAGIDHFLSQLTDSINSRISSLDELGFKLKLQKAAEKYERILQREKRIAGLLQRLENASKDQENLKKDMNRIKYSLKVLYEGRIEALKKGIVRMDAELSSIHTQIEKIGKASARLHDQLGECNRESGAVGREISNFEKEEPRILKTLGIQLYRNPLLLELNQRDIERVRNDMSKECGELEGRIHEVKSESEQLREKLNSLEIRRYELNQEGIALAVEKADIIKRIEVFVLEKQRTLEALKRLNIDAGCLFDPLHLFKASKEYLSDWENKAYNLRMEINEIEKQIHGIRTGVSYLPASFAALLKDNNLECYTGEKYLREIDEDIKKSLIAKNPLLPYAILATEKEIPLIEGIAGNMDIGQIIPMIRYNNRDQGIDEGDCGIRFLASSKNMSLDNRSLDAFIHSLQEKKECGIRELEKAAEVINRVNQDILRITGFKWTEQDAAMLELEGTRNSDAADRNHAAIEDCSRQEASGRSRLEELSAVADALKDELLIRRNRLKDFLEYLDKNAAYMENLRLFAALQDRLTSLKAALDKHEDEKAGLNDMAGELKNRLRSERDTADKTAAKLADVAGAMVDTMLDADIFELEGRLEAYKGKLNNEVAALSEQIKNDRHEIQRDYKDIGKLRLDTDEYINIAYSEDAEAELERGVSQLEQRIRELDSVKQDHLYKRSGLAERIEAAKYALNGRSILPKEQIAGNFEQRRRDTSSGIREMKAEIERIHKTNLEVSRLSDRIEFQIKDIRQLKAIVSERPYEEIKSAVMPCLDSYDAARIASDKIIDSLRTKSARFISSYTATAEGTLKEVVKALQYQTEALECSYEKYYYLCERMEYSYAQLCDILKIMQSRMQLLEHSRKDLSKHAFMEAKRIYDEIPKVSENSSVEIDGVRKKVLEIQYEEMISELQAKEKMEMYVEECLQSIIKLIKGNEDESRLSREIEKHMATKELINIISSLEKCRIRAYKVDLNENNRRMMPWEDIIVKNSGGEKFVAYFSLLVALISYSRKQVKGYDSFRKREESKVLIMDNPFGPITSGHLLKPMFDIAKKYNTQLICLSDIKQGSVLNSFDLIYMVKIRQNMMKEDFLELEPILLKELSRDEKLENAHLYSKAEQVSLLLSDKD